MKIKTNYNRRLHRRKRYQSGVSLIELMISITIGLVLIAGVTTIYTRIGAAGSENIARTRLTQQLRASMDFMSRELRKSGYVNSWDAAGTSLTGVNLDLIELFGPVTTGGTCTSGVCDCILYSYDANDDSKQGVGSATKGTNQNNDNFELFGIKKDGDAIKLRYGGKPHACGSGSWESLTDGEVDITTLTFELDAADTVDYYVAGGSVTPSTCVATEKCLQRRKVNIVLTGALATDDSITVTLEQQVAVKNDYLYTK
jgi:prepilin-type N-terminal cleavage/methylation domain-containing protein